VVACVLFDANLMLMAKSVLDVLALPTVSLALCYRVPCNLLWHVWHTYTYLEGYVRVPDLTCPVFEDVSLV